MKNGILIIVSCILFIFTGCSSVHVIKSEVEEVRKDLEGSIQLQENTVEFNRLKTTKELFSNLECEMSGEVLKLKDDYSFVNLRKYENSNATISLNIQYNNPKLINVIEQAYDGRGQLEYYQIVEKKKYPYGNGFHDVKEHADKKEAYQIKVQEEEDGYSYVHCSVCNEYIGSYGRNLSKEVNSLSDKYDGYDKLIQWLEYVENNALKAIRVVDVKEEGEFAPYNFKYSETVVMDNVIYTYMPYSKNGTKLDISYQKGQLYTPIKYQGVSKNLGIHNFQLSNFYLDGKYELLEYRNLQSYLGDDFYILNGDGEYTEIQESVPLRIILMYEQDELISVELHSTIGIFNDMRYIGDIDLKEWCLFVTSLGVNYDRVFNTMEHIKMDIINPYYRFAGGGGRGYERVMQEIHDKGDLENGVTWNFGMCTDGAYAKNKSTELIFNKK